MSCSLNGHIYGLVTPLMVVIESRNVYDHILSTKFNLFDKIDALLDEKHPIVVDKLLKYRYLDYCCDILCRHTYLIGRWC